MYAVRENDRSVQLCIDVGVTVQESITYTITSAQKVPPQAEGRRNLGEQSNFLNGSTFFLKQMKTLVPVPR